MHRILFSVILLTGTWSLQAQKYINEFLSIGVGAQGQAMGNAQVALPGDVTFAYWNPAGMVHMTGDRQVSFMHAEWFAGVANYDYLGIALKLDRNAEKVIGFNLIRLGVDNIPNTLGLFNADGSINYDNIAEFSASDYAFLASYAQKMPKWGKNISIGGTVKVIRRVIGTFGNSWGFGFDAGIQRQGEHFSWGVQAQDITTTVNAWSFNLDDNQKQVFLNTGNEIPVNSTELALPRITLGGAYKVSLGSKIGLKSALDLVATTDGRRNTLVSTSAFSVDPRIGLQLDYNNWVFLRAGASQFQQVPQNFDPNDKQWVFRPTAGIGLRIKSFYIDYALSNLGNVAPTLLSHIVSLKLDMKAPKTTFE